MKPKMVLTTTFCLLAAGAFGMNTISPAVMASDTAKLAAANETESETSSDIKLDSSSLVEFKASVEKMNASLSEADQVRLMTAFNTLAASSAEPAAGSTASDSSKPYGDGDASLTKPVLERVYIKKGAELDGKTFDEIIELVE